jgi:RNA polymerase sigma factor (sigma-70 family)
MRTALHRLLLTLAGAGVLSGAATADPAALHQELRGRVLGAVGEDADGKAEAVRDALHADPAFEPLLEVFRRQALSAVAHHPEGADAVQDALLKVWKGRPQVFLQDSDSVARYLRSAARRNLLTRIDRASGRGRLRPADVAEPHRTPVGSEEPTGAAELADLVDALAARLDGDELRVLERYLAGEESQRAIGRDLGLSRHAVDRCTGRIARELAALLDPGD